MKSIDFFKKEIERLKIEFKISSAGNNKLKINLVKSKVIYLYKICNYCEEIDGECFKFIEENLKLFGINKDAIDV